jgi:cell division initiation protein
MEISARVLREVEFNSSLRGYNTDEVDEFLEQVADGVDRLQAEAKAAIERADNAERTAHDRTGGFDDDDSIRRTLVLAQRTADLAIREAQEEAGQILDRARGEAETLVTEARESSERITSDAERRLHEDVTRLASSRDALRTEVDTLVSLLGAERERLTETLGAALRYVERSLSPSASLMSLSSSASAEADEPGDGSGGEQAEAAGDAVDPSGAEADQTAAYTIVANPEAATTPDDVGSEAASSDDGPNPAYSDGTADSGEVDDLEAAIAEDAAAAAPERQSEPDHYDWDSVIRGDTESHSEEGPSERANLTAVPPLDDVAEDTAAQQTPARGTDWP